MKLTRHYLQWITISLCLLLSYSCNHKDLYVEVGSQSMQVQVNFDFDQTGQTPAAMRVYFYPLDGNTTSQPLRFDLPPSGGMVQLAAGDYRVLAYNVDAQNILEQDDDTYDLFQLTTQRYEVEVTEQEDNKGNRSARRRLFGSNLPIGEDEQPDFPMYDTPNWACACRQELFRVEPPKAGDVSVSSSTLALTAHEAIKQVEFELSGIEGVSNATLVRGTISGIPSGYRMATGLPVNDLGLMTFAARVDEERGVILGSMTVWGFCPPDDTDARQYLNIYIWSNGGNYYVTQDITDQMRSGEASNLQHVTVHIESQGIDLTGADAGDSGFKPSVGDWEEHNSNIQL